MRPDTKTALTPLRALDWTRPVRSVALLIALLALAQGHEAAIGSRRASVRSLDRTKAAERAVLLTPPAAFMGVHDGPVDGTLIRSVMERAPIIRGTSGHLLVDTTARIPPDLVQGIARAPYVRDLSNEMNRIVEDLKGVLGPLDPDVNDVNYAGIGLGEGYIGVNINRALYSVRGRNSILVNPYRIAEEIEAWVGTGLAPADAPKEFSGRLVSAILHEIAHQSAREHDETFAATLTRLYGASIPAADRLLQRLRERIDGARYREIVSDLTRLRSQWGGQDVLAASKAGGSPSGPPGR